MEELVSVIAPVYNVEKYLEQCIKSVLKQTYSNWELILVDDGSGDDSLAICKKYTQIDGRIKCIHIENQGVSNARNCGINNARGEYIAFIDADDMYKDNYIELMVKELEEREADLIVCSYYLQKENNVEDKYIHEESKYITKEDLFANVFLRNRIGGFCWNKMFRKEVISDIRFDEKIHICEDVLFLCALMPKVKRIYFVDVPLYFYRVNENSATNSTDKLITENGSSKYAETYELILKQNNMEPKMIQFIRCAIFISSVNLHFDCKVQGVLTKELKKNLSKDFRKHVGVYIACSEITLKAKIATLLKWYGLYSHKKGCINARKR